ncbi:MAG: glutamate formimidoyltransferase [Schleiferiaceae bacterium]|jgi:glutamate formiminotransferase|nr:glutamate formimidoyltransferase [Schleiferiaceae bacterium]
MNGTYRIECIPNVSTADPDTLNKISAAIRSIPEVDLRFVDTGLSANRTVFTYIGPAHAVFEATEKMIDTALAYIDMRKHSGVHPRMGAVDVCPFVLLDEEKFQAAFLKAVDQFIEHMGTKGLPTYAYERSARQPLRRNLALVRKGEYEQLPSRFAQGDFPDVGPKIWDDASAKSGATAMGARPLMVAFNVNLSGGTKTELLQAAKQIAGRIRERDGGLPGVKSIGWYIPDLDVVQVSCNLTKPFETGVCEVFQTVQKQAMTLGYLAPDSELIGCIPKSQFDDCTLASLGLGRFKPMTSDRILPY